jgi:glutathione S-transferase
VYKLFHRPSTAAMAPHILLREIGAPHELVPVTAEAQRTPEYLALNPNGRVPVLVDGDLVLYETAAICLHLCDRHPEAGLAPALGTAGRAEFYKWLVWLTNTVQPDLIMYFYPERHVAPENAAALKARVVERLMGMFAIAGTHLADREYMVGDRFGAVDAYLLTLARWTRNMDRKARDLPGLGPYLARVADRPAVRATFEAEGLSAPYY